jgi:phosphate transport system substrate-binding protein
MSNRFLRTIVALAILLLILVPGCSRRTESDKTTVQIKGSDTMVNLSQAWAEQFMKTHPGTSIAVTGGGSGNGITSLISNTCDIAEVSREMKESEIALARQKGIDPVKNIVALDGLAVAVNAANPVNQLTIAQLADIFTGKVKNWQELGGHEGRIVLLSREVNSGTHVYFKEHVLRHGIADAKDEFSPEALLLPSSQAIVDEVTQNTDAIGYFGMGYITPHLKVLKIAVDDKSPGYAPAIELIQQNIYPISRPLIMYTKGEPAGLTKTFMEFIRSPEGQQVVRKMDFVPVL